MHLALRRCLRLPLPLTDRRWGADGCPRCRGEAHGFGVIHQYYLACPRTGLLSCPRARVASLPEVVLYGQPSTYCWWDAGGADTGGAAATYGKPSKAASKANKVTRWLRPIRHRKAGRGRVAGKQTTLRAWSWAHPSAIISSWRKAGCAPSSSSPPRHAAGSSCSVPKKAGAGTKRRRGSSKTWRASASAPTLRSPWPAPPHASQRQGPALD